MQDDEDPSLSAQTQQTFDDGTGEKTPTGLGVFTVGAVEWPSMAVPSRPTG